MRTVSLRLRNTKGQLEELGEESDGAAESVTKLQTQLLNLTKGKVNIMDDLDPTKFKSTYDIMKSMSEVWSSMTDVEQASALELLFGKNRANVGAALLSNFETAEKVLKTSENSAGSAMKEQEAYSQSLQYSLDKMKATAQEFANVTLDSSWLKAGVDGAQTLLEILTQIIDVGGGIPLMLGAIGGVNLFKNLDQPKSWLYSFTIEWVYFYGENYMVA